jgi:hypothetical protein
MSSGPRARRGTALSIWLVLVALANAYVIFRYYQIITDFVQHNDPTFTGTLQWGLYLLAGLSLVNIVCVAALFAWKRWGYHGIVASALVALVVNALIGVSIVYSISVGLICLAIMWAVLQPRWEKFS